MGVIKSCARVVCCRFLPVLVVLLAVGVGWLSQQHLGNGLVFSALYRFQGFVSGDNRVTEPVPQGFKPVQVKFESFPLQSGAKMPGIGLGMCCRPLAYHHESAKRQVTWFLVQGGRHIDTAELYMNHKSVGEGIRDAIALGVPRNEIFVATKIYPDSYGAEMATKAMNTALQELGLDYVDLVYLHSTKSLLHFSSLESYYSGFPCMTAPNCWAETWKALGVFKSKGKIRDLGVSNFNEDNLEMFEQTGVLKNLPISVNQLPFNPWLPQEAKEQVLASQKRGIQVVGYFSLGSSSATGASLQADKIAEIAKAHKVSTAQVLLRWSLHKNVAVIPGTSTPKHMVANLAAYGFKLTPREIDEISEYGQKTPDTAPLPGFMLDRMRTKKAAEELTAKKA